ncbi:MAG TPA: NAD(+)/NADH kinase [Polyangiaceae bacterium]
MKPRVCVVLKRSSWHKWVEDEKDARIVRLLEAGDETVRRMRPGHDDHAETVEEVRAALLALRAETMWSDRPHGFRVEGPCDLVVTVGGDGTLLAASHGIGAETPLLGINSAPSHSVGFFCAARKGHARAALESALSGKLRGAELTRMRVELNGRVLHDRVLNEALFCHECPAATSRYILRVLSDREKTLASEEQKSSGMWVGPAAGSTAAQKSAGGKVLGLGSKKLQFVVREPYQGGGALALTLGLVDEGESLTIKSKMRHARVFLDGDHIMHEVTIGDVVTMRRSAEPLHVLGLSRNGDGTGGKASRGAGAHGSSGGGGTTASKKSPQTA